MQGSAFRVSFQSGQDKMRLEETSQLAMTETILLIPGLAALEILGNFGKNLGRVKVFSGFFIRVLILFS